MAPDGQTLEGEEARLHIEGRRVETIAPQTHAAFFAPFVDLTGDWRFLELGPAGTASYTAALEHAVETGRIQGGTDLPAMAACGVIKGEVTGNRIVLTQERTNASGQVGPAAAVWVQFIFGVCGALGGIVRDVCRRTCNTDLRAFQVMFSFQVQATLNFGGYLCFATGQKWALFACRIEHLPFLKDFPTREDFLSSPLNAPPALLPADSPATVAAPAPADSNAGPVSSAVTASNMLSAASATPAPAAVGPVALAAAAPAATAPAKPAGLPPVSSVRYP